VPRLASLPLVVALFLVPGFCLIGQVVHAQPADADAPAEKATFTSQQVAQWIADLDSDKFLVRENATQKLAQAESAAISPLADAIRSGSLEKSIRCIHVLRSFAVGDDIDSEVAATAKLLSISKNGDDRVAQYAADVLSKMDPLKQERAIRILGDLGVRFSTYVPNQGFGGHVSGPGIVIDKDYRGTSKELHYLKDLEFIEDIQIHNRSVNADWLQHVAKMPSLRYMSIKDGPVDTEMLRELEPVLPRLRAVRFYYLDLDGSSIDVLSNLRSVQYADFFGLDFSEEDKQRLREKLRQIPDENLQFRKGGFLGVFGDRGAINARCQISNVHQDSGAYLAGLRRHDVVTHVNGEKVSDFSDLIRLLKDRSVGEVVKMDILRNEEPQTLTVTLGQWPLRETYGP